MNRTVNIRDLGAWVSSVPRERHRAVIRAIQRTVQMRGRVMIREEINATTPHRPFDRGGYQKSWRTTKLDDGAKLYSTSPYASVIDHGRRPGTWPNIGAIAEWVKRKGFVGRPKSVSAARAAARPVLKQDAAVANWKRDNEAMGIAFCIARKIKQVGTPAKNVLTRVIARLTVEVRTAVRLAIAGVES